MCNYVFSIWIVLHFGTFSSKNGVLVIFNVMCYFDLKLDSCSYYDIWWIFMWYNIALCSEMIVYSLVRTVFTKVGFCSILSILRASFGFWWVRKLIWEIRRYIWVIRGRAGLGVRFCGLRFWDLGTRVAWGVCHVSPREAWQAFCSDQLGASMCPWINQPFDLDLSLLTFDFGVDSFKWFI